jgi:hypothetical protein
MPWRVAAVDALADFRLHSCPGCRNVGAAVAHGLAARLLIACLKRDWRHAAKYPRHNFAACAYPLH